MASTSATTASSPPKPRVGGNDGTPWVGGSSKNPRKEPYDILCYRPTDFRSKQKQHENLKRGLEEHMRLDLPSTGKQAMSLINWIREIKGMVLSRGFDTVFYIPDSGSNKRFLIGKWGAC